MAITERLDMTLYEYHQYSIDEQIDLLYREGIYLGKRRKSSLSVVLYQLDSFYIEIYYNKYRRLVKQLRCFHSVDFLAPYLEQIDVDELINAY